MLAPSAENSASGSNPVTIIHNKRTYKLINWNPFLLDATQAVTSVLRKATSRSHVLNPHLSESSSHISILIKTHFNIILPYTTRSSYN
jgi:hypothetical protein